MGAHKGLGYGHWRVRSQLVREGSEWYHSAQRRVRVKTRRNQEAPSPPAKRGIFDPAPLSRKAGPGRPKGEGEIVRAQYTDAHKGLGYGHWRVRSQLVRVGSEWYHSAQRRVRVKT